MRQISYIGKRFKNDWFIVALALCFILSNCNSHSSSETVHAFIRSYNAKDSINTFKYLDENFVELWERDTVIASKADFSQNYTWGKAMRDKEIIIIVKADHNHVETISEYYSEEIAYWVLGLINLKEYIV